MYVATMGVCDAIHGIPEYTHGKEPLCGLHMLGDGCLYIQALPRITSFPPKNLPKS